MSNSQIPLSVRLDPNFPSYSKDVSLSMRKTCESLFSFPPIYWFYFLSSFLISLPPLLSIYSFFPLLFLVFFYAILNRRILTKKIVFRPSSKCTETLCLSKKLLFEILSFSKAQTLITSSNRKHTSISAIINKYICVCVCVCVCVFYKIKQNEFNFIVAF